MLGERKTAVLRGGAPWGFRLSGGIFTPVYIIKVRSRSKAAHAGLSAGDTILSVNGTSAFDKTLLELNNVIGSIRDQLILEVQSALHPDRNRFDSFSSIDTTDTSPVRSTHRLTPLPPSMDYYQYNSLRATPTYPTYTSTSNMNQYDNNRDQRYMDSYGRLTANPVPTIFRTSSVNSNMVASPAASTRGQQQFNYHTVSSNNAYDTPRNYYGASTHGYTSDSNDHRNSSVSIRPITTNNLNVPRVQPLYKSQPTAYNTKITTSNDQSYYSDSECVASGPRYTKISRQSNSRRPSNIVLPIRSMTSKAYDQYVPQEPPKPQQQPFDVYRYQQEQAAAAAAARHTRPPQLSFPSQDQRRRSDQSIDHELGAELLKSPIANKKRYADSSFFSTPYNTYPTIEEQKKLARKIATILEGGDPTQKGATKFEKQRQRAEKHSIECESPFKMTATSNYRPLHQLHQNETAYYDTPDVPDCIKHSLREAQHMNTLRYVGAPDDFKQVHMQEHVTHTMIPPQIAMSIVSDLNHNRGKGAALFQKRKARSERWVIDENNVKRPGYQATATYIEPSAKPWGQRASTSWSADENPLSGQNFSPVRQKVSLPPPTPTLPEPIAPHMPVQSGPRYGDFNAKPKGFSSRNLDNLASQSPRPSIDSRKPFNLNSEPSMREGAAEAHTRNISQSAFSPNPQQNDDYFKFPSDNILGKWKTQEYSPWNQPRPQDKQQSQVAMKRDGVDQVRQLFNQQIQSFLTQQNEKSANNNAYSSSQATTPQHFTDL
ncbi:unnamed protein product [Rotaria socialis]|uniref:PDZ domain-containing protein n=1 Tax=Rotaria socialis TaxID=392032 RepID=A0A820MDN4_9BILA|nr:unnamed protein product [Rotaria socialis]CAF3406680.1 unnamed protein product [Rotaria socialis]CAF3434950.1 unnamed protein product [Rotaria socialis]CAF3577055.1 unnamed protein product [Rotaria socialis]CAF3634457.1 unnamed protein product [Rotaria socialis]